MGVECPAPTLYLLGVTPAYQKTQLEAGHVPEEDYAQAI